jgi:hypothetical protein
MLGVGVQPAECGGHRPILAPSAGRGRTHTGRDVIGATLWGPVRMREGRVMVTRKVRR